MELIFKSDEFVALLKRIDKLKVQLSPEEEELLGEVKEKLMGGEEGKGSDGSDEGGEHQ